MPMGIVVISCVRPSVQPSMGLGLCIAYKALGRNGLQFGMLMYPDGLHSAFMDAYGYCCWSVCPSICPFVRLRLSNHLGFFFFFAFFFLRLGLGQRSAVPSGRLTLNRRVTLYLPIKFYLYPSHKGLISLVSKLNFNVFWKGKSPHIKANCLFLIVYFDFMSI